MKHIKVSCIIVISITEDKKGRTVSRFVDRFEAHELHRTLKNTLEIVNELLEEKKLRLKQK